MALFQKKPVVTSSAPAYTIGATKTLLILGLGNPEAQYTGTRHNIGFAVVSEFAKSNDFGDWVSKRDLKAQLAIRTLGESRVILAMPTTYMNDSGASAQAIQHFYRIYNPQTLAVYDELAIPFGQIRTRVGGSDAGHNGVKSLIQHIGDDFARARIGVGNDRTGKISDADFVLSKFSKSEQENLPKVMREAEALLTEYIFSGQLPHDTRAVI
jgi:PTH1 family peptidyl-tRNA hydrolase